MITDREQRRLNKIRKDIASRVKLDRKDAQWALDLARREGATLFPQTVKEAAKQGFNVNGIKTKE
jgi:hypothetical protein